MILLLSQAVLFSIFLVSGGLFLWAIFGGRNLIEILSIPLATPPWYWMLALSGVSLAGFTLLWRMRGSPAFRLEEREQAALLVLFKVGFAVLLAQMGYLFISSDDFCRIVIGWFFSRRFQFAPWDHVWLAGQFYVLAGMIRVLSDPLVSARLAALLFSVGYAVVFYRLIRGVFGHVTALMGLLVLGVLRYPTWLSVAAHANPYFLFFSLLGVLFLMEGGRKWSSLVAAGLSFCAASAFRYEGLLLGGVFGLWNLGIVLRHPERRSPGSFALHFLLCLVPLLYITAWAVDCYRLPHLGDPFHFLRKARQMTDFAVINMSPLHRTGWYPEALWDISQPLVVLGLIGIPLGCFFGGSGRKRIAMYLLFAALNFALLIGSVVWAGGNVMRERVVILTQVLLLPFAVFPLAWVVEKARSLPRRPGGAVRLAAVVGLLAFAIYEAVSTWDFPSPMRGVPPDAYALAWNLHTEFRERRPSVEDVQAIIMDGMAGAEVTWIFQVVPRHPEKVHLLTREHYGDLYNAVTETGLCFYVGLGSPETRPRRSALQFQQGPYFLASFQGGQPADFLREIQDRFQEPMPEGFEFR